VLGVSPDISEEDLHRHYRKLMVENHPDKLIARGLPQEMVQASAGPRRTISGSTSVRSC
jgi:DnaJ like chaperone protein